MARNNSLAEDSSTELNPQMNSERFCKIGGIYLAPVPEIEEEFYEQLVDQILSSSHP